MGNTVSIKIENKDLIQAAFSRAPELMRAALTTAVNKSLLIIGRQSVINITEGVYAQPISKSGYRRTGNLRASILNPNQGLHLASGGVFSGEVGSGTNYGLFVEKGTRFMPGRPFLKPAVESTREEVNLVFKEAVQGVLDTIGKGTKL